MPNEAQNQKNPPVENGRNQDGIFSPGFKSAAAMAGWDEEALLLASLIVEDTPERDFKHKKRFDVNFKTPPTNSRRKRRAQGSPQAIPAVVLNLDEEETPRKDSVRKKKEKKISASEENKILENELKASSSSALPCMDKLRDELSCAICLEICFEPSTTPCGHSFCRKCLRSAADKCGKRCPKCRQLISNGRSCTVNTVLWNTIQLLFPQEVEARKAAGALNSREASQSVSPHTAFYNNLRNPSTQPSSAISRGSRRRGGISIQDEDEDAAMAIRLQREFTDGQSRRGSSWVSNNDSRNEMRSSLGRLRTRRGISNQDGDAALALSLQREEFMEAFRESHGQSSPRRPPSLPLARANLRAMASRAINIRIRDRTN